MKIRDIAVDRLKPYPGNPRIIERAVSRVAKSLQEFGFNQPIVVDKDMVVIVGHARLEAAKSLGLEKVPVLVAEHLTEEQAKAYRLADNKTGEFAQWDDSKLLLELQSLSDFGQLEVTGFTQSEMLALEMQAKALLEATTPAPKQSAPATSLAGSEPSPAPDSSMPGDPDPYQAGMEQENDHDGSEEEEAPQAPSMVRFEAVVDEEQRRAIVSALNEAKTKSGCETLGAALHIVCLEWMESRR